MTPSPQHPNAFRRSSCAALADRIPAQLYIVGSGLIQYVGAALAVIAFASVEPASVAWSRVVTGAVVLLAWKRQRDRKSVV